jgi:hypothetical protein
MAAEAQERQERTAALKDLANSLQEREFFLTAQRSQVALWFLIHIGHHDVRERGNAASATVLVKS